MRSNLSFNRTKTGKNTIEINGVEYYQPQRYGISQYFHLNDQQLPIRGGKKSKFVSDALDVIIDKGVKYGAVGSALAASILNPELAPLAPAGIMLASDLAPPISRKLRKTVYEKTGYGYYGGADKMGKNVKDLDDEDDVKVIAHKNLYDTKNEKLKIKKTKVKKMDKAPAKPKRVKKTAMSQPSVPARPKRELTVKQKAHIEKTKAYAKANAVTYKEALVANAKSKAKSKSKAKKTFNNCKCVC